MAITVAKPYFYQDLNSLAIEPLRGLHQQHQHQQHHQLHQPHQQQQQHQHHQLLSQHHLAHGLDSTTLPDPMEFGLNTIDETISRHNVFNTQDILTEYVDATGIATFADSKDAWTADFAKCIRSDNNLDSNQRDGGGGGSCGIGGTFAVQHLQLQQQQPQHQQQQQSRKRRMDWSESLVLQPSNGNGSDSNSIGETNNTIGPNGAKLAHTSNNNTGDKQQQRKPNSSSASTSSNSGRLGWTDEIDFDINSELASNSYLNNDAFLSLSSALTILKHEIPSPSSGEPQKNTQQLQQPQQQLQQPQQKNGQDSVIVRDNIQQQQHQQCTAADIVSMNHANSNSNSNDQQLSSQQQHQQQQQQQQQSMLQSIQQQQQLQSQPQQQAQMPFKGLLTATENAGIVATTSNGQSQLDSVNTSGDGTAADIGTAKQQQQHPSASVDKPIGEQSKFQYVLAASTSIATKTNEDTLTYLNQGQSYEIKLKKLGDLSAYRGKMLKSIIKICFHERRLQYMEREQMLLWQASRPGDRIVEIDVPLSYGLCQVAQSASPQLLNTVEVLWDPMKEVGVYIQVNCISTEFTPKKHGGEKGVPFRIQVETYLDGGRGVLGVLGGGILSGGGEAGGPPPLTLIHAAACQIKVFKLKGADRKHKQDREKIHKRTATEQEKYQPSYECTILSDIPNESISAAVATVATTAVQSTCYSPEQVPLANRSGDNSPVHATSMFNSAPPTSNSTAVQQQQQQSQHPIGINSVSSSNSNVLKHHQQQQQQHQLQQQHIIDQSSSQSLSPNRNVELADEAMPALGHDSSPVQLLQWLNHHRLGQHASTFAHFSGADLMRMSKEDIIQICGVADGIRMYNTIHSKAITPRLTIYVSFDGTLYHAIYLHANTTSELSQKLCRLPGFQEYAHGSRFNGSGGGGSAANDTNVFSTWSHPSSKFAANSPSASRSLLAADTTRLAIYVNGPGGIHVLVTDEVLDNIKDDALFAVEFQAAGVLMKAVYKNEASN